VLTLQYTTHLYWQLATAIFHNAVVMFGFSTVAGQVELVLCYCGTHEANRQVHVLNNIIVTTKGGTFGKFYDFFLSKKIQKKIKDNLSEQKVRDPHLNWSVLYADLRLLRQPSFLFRSEGCAN